MAIIRRSILAGVFVMLTASFISCTPQTGGANSSAETSAVDETDTSASAASGSGGTAAAGQAAAAAMADGTPGVDVCSIARRVSQATAEIILHPGAIVSSSQDECVLAILDSLATRFVESGNTRFLVALDTLHAVDDGYVADAVPDIVVDLAQRRLGDFLDYLYAKRNIPSALEPAFVEGLAGAVEETPDEQPARLWRSRVQQALGSGNSPRRRYTDSLFQAAGMHL